MNEIVLQVNNVSKKYCHSLKKSMLYGCIDILRDSFGLKAQPDTLRKDEFWSVKDVSFSLERGQCLGIIGPNGAGKSTLLKMLNGIIKPDKGDIWYKGKMGALIEVGAGFQPVLSGRENIYINGSIIGLSSKEIKDKFDEIVAFSGLEEFLDMPVKNYSSGMRVRLGFSIAAHLHPDILLVDEVLAVGDLAFQAKCRNKIAEMVKNGTAIILISHNMHHIANLCSRTIVIHKGTVLFHGNTSLAIDKYRSCGYTYGLIELGGHHARVSEVSVLNINGIPCQTFNTGESLVIRISIECDSIINNPIIALGLMTTEGQAIASMRTDSDNICLGSSKLFSINLTVKEIIFSPGIFYIDITLLHNNGFGVYHKICNAAQMQILGGNKITGLVNLKRKWDITQK
ncbi:MAG: ABC transporter ATP-binding protein [Sedimentisphaerales bacterium]|nr:ABC transporter ATP-binding protein [Sedimentisphaerales bacterium]MBN2843842.1 ABC transporter ATP-binding protein [Sedimentisphaerales bacterium]